MSFMYPRRVKDLPRLESDSEDELNTPMKRRIESLSVPNTNHEEETANRDKENELNLSNSSHNKNITYNQFRNLPKRSCELPTLESDSDDDNICKDDNLNCAILNDSFILTPGKDDISYSFSNSSSRIVGASTELNGANSSLVNRFNSMGLGSVRPAKPAVSLIDNSSFFPPKSESVISQATNNRDFNEKKPLISIEAPVKRFNSEPTADAHNEQFATPQIRSFSVQRRPRNICSTQSQKSRSNLVNEFRSQKVLFQTPMAITRAPNSCLPNDSITLSSLCDSLNSHHSDTPGTTEKDSSKISPKSWSRKSKKSLDGMFQKVEVCEDTKEFHCINETESQSCSKQNILEINNAHYSILQKLGTGGSSSVYSAQRVEDGEECALKIVDLRGDAAIVEGYLNETKLLAKLQGNASVITLYDYQLIQKESKLYMVMEKGESDLSKILQKYKTKLPAYAVLCYLYQIFQAVNYIHHNGVIHSDLKPANFLLIGGRIKLIDFGIASNIAVDSTSIIKFSQAGTFNYISPEALIDTSTASSPMRNQPKIKISTKSDVWSLGCILYLFLYQKTPFSHILSIYAKISAISSPTYAIEYPDLPSYYPPMLLEMVKSCLQHDPKLRPSCDDLLNYPFHMVIPISALKAPLN